MRNGTGEVSNLWQRFNNEPNLGNRQPARHARRVSWFSSSKREVASTVAFAVQKRNASLKRPPGSGSSEEAASIAPTAFAVQT